RMAHATADGVGLGFAGGGEDGGERAPAHGLDPVGAPQRAGHRAVEGEHLGDGLCRARLDAEDGESALAAHAAALLLEIEEVEERVAAALVEGLEALHAEASACVGSRFAGWSGAGAARSCFSSSP